MENILKNIGKIISIFIFSLFIYTALTGRYTINELIIGSCISLIISLISFRFIPLEIKYLNPVRIFWLAVYIPFFIWQMIKANFQIALVVINPSLPIKPDIVKAKTELNSPLGKLLLTSSITLTPGTLSVDIKDNLVKIHCVKADLDGNTIIKTFEKYIKRITE